MKASENPNISYPQMRTERKTDLKLVKEVQYMKLRLTVLTFYITLYKIEVFQFIWGYMVTFTEEIFNGKLGLFSGQ